MVFCRAQADWRSAAWLVRLVLSAGACSLSLLLLLLLLSLLWPELVAMQFCFSVARGGAGLARLGRPRSALARPLRSIVCAHEPQLSWRADGAASCLGARPPGSNRPRDQEVHCQLPLSPASPPAAFHPSYSSRLLTSSGQDQLNGLGRRTPVDKLPRERQFEYAAAANAGPAGFVRAQVSIHQKS